MTILSESTVRIGTTFGHIGLFFVFVFFISAIYLAHANCAIPGLIVTVLLTVIFILFIIYGTEPHKRIKVLLEDDYSFVNLYEEYDIEECDGDIWVLMEKEPKKGDK